MISPDIKGIYVADVSDTVPHRNTKHCVCVSVGRGKYLLINTHHRPMYEDFILKASNYGFLNGLDRFLSCSSSHPIKPEKLFEKVGELSDADTKIMYEKIQKSQKIQSDDKKAILSELEKTFK